MTEDTEAEDKEELPDPIKRLAEAIEKKGSKISFSKNCISGFVGRDKCQCWRCRGDRDEEVTKESEALAKQNRKKHDQRMMRKVAKE